MPELITIKQIAKRMGVSYHVARNRLNRDKATHQYKHKLEHSIVYDVKVLEVLECKDQ